MGFVYHVLVPQIVKLKKLYSALLRSVLIMSRKHDVLRTMLRFYSSYRPYNGQIVTEHELSYILCGYESNTITVRKVEHVLDIVA